MNNTNYYKYYNVPKGYQNSDRQFVVPFLFGALTGGAAVGLTRPRPIVNAAPQGGYPYPSYNPGAPYYNQSYSYYVPYRPY